MARELFTKRRVNLRYVIISALIVGVFFGIGVIIGWFSHTSSSSSDSSKQTAEDNFNYADFIVNNVNRDRIRDYLREYSKEPRLEGTEKDAELAKLIQSYWQDNGLDEVHLSTYYVLLSFPNKSDPNVIQIKNTSTDNVIFETKKYEVVLTPAENNSEVVPPYNAYSPAADVTGPLVYVNYGRIEDFLYLNNTLSINVAGAIVIARYGKIFRGDKVKNAERFNAAGVILYSDPKDFNVDQTKPYPDSWWLPPTGIQRGTVGFDGDQETPLYPSTYYANRVEATSLPKIPCQPIGYIDAIELLRWLAGQEAPEDWRGSLDITYHIGPGYGNNTSLKVRLKVNNYREVKPIYNVIGLIRGSEEADRYILLGNHHDAWVFGAIDPLSGTAALTELTRIYGLLLKSGRRPRRTIVFCSWDAEEQGLLGSIEWVEEHLKVLLQRGVAYLNVDYAAISNYTLGIGSSPLLQDVAYNAAKLVPSQDPQFETMYHMWLKRPRSQKVVTEPDLYYSLGSGSDQGAFYQRAGVSCVDMWMTYDEANVLIPTYPLYHSSYETFYAFEKFVDPGFAASAAITKLWGVMASNLANAKLLPFSVERYSTAVSTFYSSLNKTSWEKRGINVAAMDSAVQNFTKATKTFQENVLNDASILNSPLQLRMVNDRLIQLERAFLDPEGLPGQPAQKHVMFAPSQFDSYVDNSFPGIVDTLVLIDQGFDKWSQLKQQVFIATYIIQSAASTLETFGL